MANIGYIQLNRICNQNCLFCSNPDTGATLSFEDFKEKVDDFIKRDYEGVILTGGEPTLIDYLPQAIEYCDKKNINCRLITNGQVTSDYNYLANLVNKGLQLMHVSLYSYKPKIQNYLSQNKNSFSNIIKTLKNARRLNLALNINTVINKYNANHLDKNVYYIIKRFPEINHFVFNNLDPYMNRASKNIYTIPKLIDFKISLNKAMNLLDNNKKTFRVERVPLCFMGDFPETSTETRKIIKDEERIVYFLDEKGLVRQTKKYFYHKKGEICKVCSLVSICAGLYALGEYFDEKELIAFHNKSLKKIIINKIKYGSV